MTDELMNDEATKVEQVDQAGVDRRPDRSRDPKTSSGGPSEPRPWPKVGRLRRLGPALFVVAALVAAGAVATTRSQTTTSSAGGRSSSSPANPARNSSLPVTYQMAQKTGRTSDYHWMTGCDRSTGRLAIPSLYAPPCVPAFHGSNGGATTAGVTATTIKVVYYISPPGDLLSAIQGVTGSIASNTQTVENYATMFNHVLQLYGRHVDIVPFNATGISTDAVAARADAITVGQQIHAFASIGGPAQTSAYADELAHLHVLCFDCAFSATHSGYAQGAPYLWGIQPTPDTLLTQAFRYVATQLLHRDAVYAGEAKFRHERRVFAVVHYDENPPIYAPLTAQLDRKFKSTGLRIALTESYLLDLSELPAEAATIAAHLKRVGATTVIFAGDPIMPIYLTKACAAIGYYPEWVITGTILTDTSTLGRYYDQSEWAHAFGLSSLAVPTPIQLGEAYHVYHWYYGTDPPALRTAPVIYPLVQQLFYGLQMAGPHLTPTNFEGGMFRLPPTGGGPITPLASYGYQGAPPLPSYTIPSDYTFLWYNPTAKGTDEQGVYGSGMMEYVDGGRRYPSTKSPTAEVPMFQQAGSVTQYSTYPPGQKPPTYPSWPGSPAAKAA